MLTSGSSQGGLLELGISLVMQDRFSQPAREASSELRRLHQEAKNAVEANLQAAEQMGNTISNVGQGLVNMWSQAFDYGLAYQGTMFRVKAITESTEEEYKQMSELAKEIGQQTLFNAKDVSEGMQYLAMAGASAKEVQDMIYAATYLASATAMEIGGKGGAADLMTNVMKTFRYEGEGAAHVVSDILTKATLSANMSVTDLAESIKYAGATAVMMKRSLQETAAAIGTLGNAGIQGSMAGTALSNALMYLNRAFNTPNSYGADWLRRLGINKEDLYEANGELRNLGVVFGIIGERIKQLPADQAADALQRIFGVRGQRGANAMITALQDYWKIYNKIMYESKGYAAAINEEIMSSPFGKFDMAKESLKTALITLVESATPALITLFDAFSGVFNLVSKFLQTPIGKLFANALAYATPLVPLLGKVIVWTSRIKQGYNDTLVTGRNMFRAMFTGWKNQVIAASDYKRILLEIQMLQAGMVPGREVDSYMVSMGRKKQAALVGELASQRYPARKVNGYSYSAKWDDRVGNFVLYERKEGYRQIPKKLGTPEDNAHNRRVAGILGMPGYTKMGEVIHQDQPAKQPRTQGWLPYWMMGGYWREKYSTPKVFGSANYNRAAQKEAINRRSSSNLATSMNQKEVINRRSSSTNLVTSMNQTATESRKSRVVFSGMFNWLKSDRKKKKQILGSQSKDMQPMSASEALSEMRAASTNTSKAVGNTSMAATNAANAAMGVNQSASSIAQATQNLNRSAAAMVGNAIVTNGRVAGVIANSGKAASKASQASQAAGKAAAGAAAAGMAAGAASRGIRTAVGKGLFRYGLGSGLKFLGKSIIPKLLGSIVGFLGGPLGIAIGALTWLLPTIISSISSHKESQDKNADATNKLTQEMQYERLNRANISPDLNQEEQMKVLANAIAQWSQRLEEGLQKYQVGNIVINLDGKKAIEEILSNRDKEINVDLGAATGM